MAGATNRFLETQLEESRGKLEAQEQAARRIPAAARPASCRRRRRPTSSRCRAPSSRRRAWSNRWPGIATASRCSSGCTTRRRSSRRRRRSLPVGAPVGSRPPASAPRCRSSSPPPGPTWRRSSSATSPITRTWPGPDDRSPSSNRRPPKRTAPRRRRRRHAAAGAERRRCERTGPARERLRGMAAEIESLDRQIAFKEAEERRVRGEIAEYQRRLEAVPRLESAWVKLTRDYDTQQLAYRELLTKSTAAQVAANLEGQDIGERFRIVDPALVPVLPLRSMRSATTRWVWRSGSAARPWDRGVARVQGPELLDGGRRLRRPVASGARHRAVVSTPADKARRARRRQIAVRQWQRPAPGVARATSSGRWQLWNSLIEGMLVVGRIDEALRLKRGDGGPAARWIRIHSPRRGRSRSPLNRSSRAHRRSGPDDIGRAHLVVDARPFLRPAAPLRSSSRSAGHDPLFGAVAASGWPSVRTATSASSSSSAGWPPRCTTRIRPTGCAA